jgi:hypothetical protein
MPNVFYTDRRFRQGDLVDTRRFCEENQSAVEALGQDHLEVEQLLAEARILAEEERRTERDPFFHGLPDRMCSIVVVPWPTYAPARKVYATMYAPRELMVDPPGEGRYCWYVTPKRDALRTMTDERWVDALVERWSEIRQAEEAWRMATSYWRGEPFPETLEIPSFMSFLVEGLVMVDGECTEGGSRRTPEVA